MTDEVYQAHRANVLEPDREVQGYYIDKIEALAKAQIEGSEETRMRCTTFKEVDATCLHIGKQLKIKRHQVYPALNIIGRDKVYNMFKTSGQDIFDDIKELRDRSMDLSYSSINMMDELKRFVPATTIPKSIRVTRQTSQRAQDTAADAGIRTSELNLYYTMHGIKILIEVEPQFMGLVDNEVVQMIMSVLRRSENSLQMYCDNLRGNTNGTKQ